MLIVFKNQNFNNRSKKNNNAIPVSMTSPSRSVMIELMWLMRNGILKIISFVEPFCLISPSTYGEKNLFNLSKFGITNKNHQFIYRALKENWESSMKTLGPLTRVPSCQGLTPLMWAAAKKYLVYQIIELIQDIARNDTCSEKNQIESKHLKPCYYLLQCKHGKKKW